MHKVWHQSPPTSETVTFTRMSGSLHIDPSLTAKQLCLTEVTLVGFPRYRYRCHPTTLSYRGTRKLWLLTPNPAPLGNKAQRKSSSQHDSEKSRWGSPMRHRRLQTQQVPPKPRSREAEKGNRGRGVRTHHLLGLTRNCVPAPGYRPVCLGAGQARVARVLGTRV